jgi:hypothetical protein
MSTCISYFPLASSIDGDASRVGPLERFLRCSHERLERHELKSKELIIHYRQLSLRNTLTKLLYVIARPAIRRIERTGEIGLDDYAVRLARPLLYNFNGVHHVIGDL